MSNIVTSGYLDSSIRVSSPVTYRLEVGGGTSGQTWNEATQTWDQATQTWDQA